MECRASADTNVSVKAIHPLTCLTELGWRRDFRECTKGPKDKCFVHLAVDADRPLTVRSLRTMLPFASMSCHHYGKTIHIRCQIANNLPPAYCLALPCLARKAQATLSGMAFRHGFQAWAMLQVVCSESSSPRLALRNSVRSANTIHDLLYAVHNILCKAV